MAGSATVTTVPSRNAMLEPAVAAASTHRRDDGVHGVASPPSRMSASSHGGLPIWLMNVHMAGNRRSLERSASRGRAHRLYAHPCLGDGSMNNSST